MIILAPVIVTQGDIAELQLTYMENGIRKNFTGWTGVWSINRAGVEMATGTCTMQSDGDILYTITNAQIDTLVVNQFRGRTLADTFFQIWATNGTDSLQFRAAVTVLRGIDYTLTQAG